MSSNKLGKFILGGALLGAVISMLDRSTRQMTVTAMRTTYEKAMYYKENPDVIKNQFQEKKDQVQNLYEQVKGDVDYVKSQVDEIKTLTPQLKEMFADTKEAISNSKSEYEQIIDEDAAAEPGSEALVPAVQKKNIIPAAGE